MRVSCESFSNEIDESDVQFEKHDEQRISTLRGIVIDVIRPPVNEPEPIRAIRSVAAREGKKADDGTMTSSLDADPTAVADLADGRTLTPATTTEASDILMSN
jgi:hypothetical protein